MSIKSTLCALVVAAGLALAPKTSDAGFLDDMIKKDKDSVESNEYSISKTWRWTDRPSQGLSLEFSDAERRIWFSLGAYFLNNLARTSP